MQSVLSLVSKGKGLILVESFLVATTPLPTNFATRDDGLGIPMMINDAHTRHDYA